MPPAINLGFVNPDAFATKVSLVPGIMFVPGEIDSIETDAGGTTVIVCVVLAELPTLSEIAIEMTCVPTSFTVGVQANLPPPEMLLEVRDDEAAPAKESESTYSVPDKPTGVAVNVIRSRAGIVGPGTMS